MANFFDQFDQAPGGQNFFDQFDEGKEPPKTGIMGRVKDAGIAALKGAIGVPEAAVGLADIATGGRVGKFLENEDGLIGFRPQQAKESLDQYLSPEQQRADQAFAESDGVMGAAQAALSNPSVISQAAIQSLPAMFGGGLLARGLLKAAPKVGGAAAAGIGEGAVGAGMSAAAIRQETVDGLLTPEQSVVAAGSGVLTGALGVVGAKVARSLGIADVDQMVAGVAQAGSAAQKGVVRRVLEGAIVEGGLEELPQSIQEQVAQNYALGKPLDEGVAHSAVLGALTGAAIGGGVAPFTSPAPTVNAADEAMDRLADAPSVDDAIAAAQDVVQATSEAAAPIEAQATAAAQALAEGKARRERGKETMDFIRKLPEAQRQEAMNMLAAGDNMQLPPGVRRFAQNRLDGMLDPMRQADMNAQDSRYVDAGPLSQPAQEGIDTSGLSLEQPIDGPLPTVDEQVTAAIDTAGLTLEGSEPVAPRERAPAQLRADPPVIDRVDAYVNDERRTNTPAARAFVQDFEAGRITREDVASTMARRAETPDDRIAAAAKQAPANTGIILRLDGKPFATRSGAFVESRRQGGSVIEVPGGFAVRSKDAPGVVDVPRTSVVAAGANDGRGVDPAGSGLPMGRAPSDGTGPGAGAAAATARSSEPAVPVGDGGQSDAALSAVSAPAAVKQSLTAAPSEDIAGPALDSEWTAFKPESGTKSVPRAEMPQIKAVHRGAMVQFLKGRGIEHESDVEVDAASLKPTQAEFSPAKVAKAKGFDGGDRSILISSDGHVLDGHHQWLAKREAGEPVKAIRLNATIDELLPLAREFPSSTVADGATPSTNQGERNGQEVQRRREAREVAAPVKPKATPSGGQAYDFTTNEDMNGRVFISPPGFRKGVKGYEVTLDRTGGAKDEKGRTKFYPTVTIGKYRTEEAARKAAENAVAENRKSSPNAAAPETTPPASSTAAPGAAAPGYTAGDGVTEGADDVLLRSPQRGTESRVRRDVRADPAGNSGDGGAQRAAAAPDERGGSGDGQRRGGRGLGAVRAADEPANQPEPVRPARGRELDRLGRADEVDAAPDGDAPVFGRAPPTDSQSLRTKAFYANTKYDSDKASPQQAMADAIDVLGFDPGLEVVAESRPARPDAPMRYSLDDRKIYYNTDAAHWRAVDVQYMLEEVMHALDHVGGINTLSASDPAWLPGGEFWTELDASRDKSSAMRDEFAYPFDEAKYTDTEKAAELFARSATMYHAASDLLRTNAPNTYVFLKRLFTDSGRVRQEVQQSSPDDTQARGDPGGGARTDGRSGGGPANRQGAGLERLRGILERIGGGRRDGAPVTFSRGDASLDTRAINAARSGAAAVSNFFASPIQAPTTTGWTIPAASKLDDLRFTVQDKLIDTRRAVESIELRVGKLAADINPYQAETLYHGRAAKQTSDFLEGEVKPLLREMEKRGVTMEDFADFLHARHAEERNAQIASINPKMPDGGSGMTNADAQKYLAGLAPAKRTQLEAAAAKLDAITAGTRKYLVDTGLESPEAIKAWTGAYKHYVPLQRADMGEDGSLSHTGSGFSVKGSASKRAMGSSKEVIDILANAVMQRERAITRAEKNRVAQAVYGLAVTAPNKDFWLPVNPDSQPMTPIALQELEWELISMGLDPDDAKNVAKEPTKRVIDPKTGLVTDRINPALRGKDNVLALRVNGKDRFVFFNERNQRSARMVSALKNLDAPQLGALMGTSAKISRYFASMNTQYNPVFGVINLVRDFQGTMFNLSSTELGGRELEVARQMPGAIKGIAIALRDRRAGKPTNSAWAQLYDDFERAGGKTGFRDMFATSTDRAKALQSELNRSKRWPSTKFVRWIGEALTDYNDTLENGVRLSVYKVALDSGLTKERAAVLAKEITVNFNRKGHITSQAGALYAFFNAAVQGTTRLAQTMKGPAGKKIMAGGMLLGAMQTLMLSMAGFDDEEPPEFIRERNTIIPIGDGKYIAIPMPLGLHVIPNIGRITTEWALDGFKAPGDRVMQLVNVMADAFNPIGNAGLSLQTIAPTAIDPFAALAENTDWTGKPIAREDFNSLKPTPGFTRTKETASAHSRWASEAINWLTGGTDFRPGAFSPTPDQIDYLIGQVTGGVGRELSKVQQTVGATFSGQELPAYKIPLVGRLYGDTKGQAAEGGKFYSNIRELNLLRAELDGRRKAGEDVSEFLADNPAVRLEKFAATTYKRVSNLRRLRREKLEAGAPAAEVEALEERITVLMRTLNERMGALED